MRCSDRSRRRSGEALVALVVLVAVGGGWAPGAEAASPLYRSRILADAASGGFVIEDVSRRSLERFSFDGDRVTLGGEDASPGEPRGGAPPLDRAAGDGWTAAIRPWSPYCEITEGAGAAATRPRRVRLPITPGLVCRLGDGGQVAIADAFDGRLAVVDVSAAAVVAEGAVAGHNIGGLRWLPDASALAVTHQALKGGAAALRGSRVANRLSLLAYDAAGGGFDEAGVRVIDLDAAIRGAADPGPMLDDRRGRLVIALGGAGRVAALELASEAVTVSPVEFVHPIDLVWAEARETLLVLDDTAGRIFALDGQTLEPRGTWEIPRDDQPWPADRGRAAFFDARLSGDLTASCHSCHVRGHTPGVLADTGSDGSFGTPKLIPTLLGTGLTDPWGWTGSMKDLHTQTRQSIGQTLGGESPSGRVVNDLVAFMQRLDPPPPKVEAGAEAARRGAARFEQYGCVECHAGFTYTSHAVFDVGLRDEAGQNEFNPPSLRGVGHRRRLLHDGRAAGLEDLFENHGHGLPGDVSAEALAELVAFLKSL